MPVLPSPVCMCRAATSYATPSRQFHREQALLRLPPPSKGGEGGKVPPPSSRFSAGASFPCSEVEKEPPSHACPYPRQPPRRPALREDAVEIRYRPPPTSGNRKTPQRGFSRSFQGAGRDLQRPCGRSVSSPRAGWTWDCPPSLTPRRRGVRKLDRLRGPAPPQTAVSEQRVHPPTCVSAGTPKAIPLPGGFP